MAVILDPLFQSILDAPVGQVESTLKVALECDVYLDIIEQNQISGTNFVRKIIITANELPVILAIVNFDSKILPSNVSSELGDIPEGDIVKKPFWDRYINDEQKAKLDDDKREKV